MGVCSQKAMGGCCSGNGKDPKPGAGSRKTEAAYDGMFGALQAEKVPHVKAGSPKEDYTFGAQIPGVYCTFHGESRAKQSVAITQIVYSEKMTKAQAVALSVMMKYKPSEKAEKSQASVLEAFYDESTLTLISEVRTSSSASQAVAQRAAGVPYDEECVAAMFYDVAQAIHDLHRHKLLQANLSFEGLLGEHKAPDGAKPDADKTVISVQIPTFGLNTLGGTKPQDAAKAVHHKGACAPEILLDATNSVQPTEETDAWNLGVLLHVMLVGYPPLQEEEKEAKEQMEGLRGGAKFPIAEHYWRDICPDARDLVEGLLNVDPTKRLTVKQAIDDQWISRPGGTGVADMKETRSKLIEMSSATAE